MRNKRGQVAQLVEQRTENPRVGGSIPSLATIQTITDNFSTLAGHRSRGLWFATIGLPKFLVDDLA
jgi:hypothetical protein